MAVLKLKLPKTKDYNLMHWLDMGNPYFLLWNPSRRGGLSLISKWVLVDMSHLFLRGIELLGMALFTYWYDLICMINTVHKQFCGFDNPPNLKRVLECSVPLVCGLFKCTMILRKFAQKPDDQQKIKAPQLGRGVVQAGYIAHV